MPDRESSRNIVADSIASLFVSENQKIEKVHVESISLQAASAPSMIPLHASMRRINRVEQVEQLVDALGVARSARRARPLVVVVRGLPDDDQLSFVQRIGEYDLSEELMMPCRFLGPIDWPRTALRRLQLQLFSKLVEGRNALVPEPDKLVGEIMDLVAASDRSLVFSHSLDPRVCRERPDLLEEWAQLIGETGRNPGNGLLICFLCVQFDRPHSEWLYEQLETLGARYGWCLLDPLDPLEPEDLVEWIDQYNSRPAIEALTRIEPELADAIFEGAESLRYRKAVARLWSSLGPSLQTQGPGWIR